MLSGQQGSSAPIWCRAWLPLGETIIDDTTVVSTKLTSDRLSLHPIVSFGSTILGASLTGLLGEAFFNSWRRFGSRAS